MITLIFLALHLFSLLAESPSNPGLIPYRIGEKFGYCDAENKLIIKADYSSASPFVNGIAIVSQGQDKVGMIDRHGKFLLRPLYDAIYAGDIFLRVRKGNRFALVSHQGEFFSDFDYTRIEPEYSGLYLVETDWGKGMLDTSGKIIVPAHFDHIKILKDEFGNTTDLIETWKNQVRGLFDRCGNEISSPRYKRIDNFHEGFAVVQLKYKFGLIDLEGREIVKPVYQNAHAMREGLAAVQVRGRWGYVNSKGQEIIPFLYEAVHDEGFFQGRASVRFKGIWTFIDRKGKEDVPVQGRFRCMGVLADGLIAACIMNPDGFPRYGYIHANGKKAIDFNYDKAYAFKNGFAIVAKRQISPGAAPNKFRYGILNRKGKVILPLVMNNWTETMLKRDSLARFGRTSFRQGERRCYVDSKGRTFGCSFPLFRKLQMEYSLIRCVHENMIALGNERGWGFCDRKGEIVVPLRYAKVDCFHGGFALVWPKGEGALPFYIDQNGKEYFQHSPE